MGLLGMTRFKFKLNTKALVSHSASSLQGGAHDSSSKRDGYLRMLCNFKPLLRQWVEDSREKEERQAALERSQRSLDTAAASMLRPAVQETAPNAPIVIAMG